MSATGLVAAEPVAEKRALESSSNEPTSENVKRQATDKHRNGGCVGPAIQNWNKDLDFRTFTGNKMPMVETVQPLMVPPVQCLGGAYLQNGHGNSDPVHRAKGDNQIRYKINALLDKRTEETEAPVADTGPTSPLTKKFLAVLTKHTDKTFDFLWDTLQVRHKQVYIQNALAFAGKDKGVEKEDDKLGRELFKRTKNRPDHRNEQNCVWINAATPVAFSNNKTRNIRFCEPSSRDWHTLPTTTGATLEKGCTLSFGVKLRGYVGNNDSEIRGVRMELCLDIPVVVHEARGGNREHTPVNLSVPLSDDDWDVVLDNANKRVDVRRGTQKWCSLSMRPSVPVNVLLSWTKRSAVFQQPSSKEQTQDGEGSPDCWIMQLAEPVAGKSAFFDSVVAQTEALILACWADAKAGGGMVWSRDDYNTFVKEKKAQNGNKDVPEETLRKFFLRSATRPVEVKENGDRCMRVKGYLHRYGSETPIDYTVVDPGVISGTSPPGTMYLEDVNVGTGIQPVVTLRLYRPYHKSWGVRVILSPKYPTHSSLECSNLESGWA